MSVITQRTVYVTSDNKTHDTMPVAERWQARLDLRDMINEAIERNGDTADDIIDWLAKNVGQVALLVNRLNDPGQKPPV